MKQLLTMICFLAAVMLSTSCQKELPDDIKIDVNQGGKAPTPTPTPELKVSEPGQFSAQGGQQTITITATDAWTLSKSTGSDWLTVKTMSGSAGTTNVDLVAAENTSTELRKATITVSSGELKKVVELSQSAANSKISLDVDNLNFTSDSGSKSFSIKSNVSWTVSSSQSWCSVSPASGSSDGSVTVRVDENTSISERTATITVESKAGNQTVKVVQSGAAPVLQLNKKDMSFTSAKGSDSFSITSNTSWSVTSSQDWCMVSSSSGSNNATVTVNVSENTSTDSRTATITVKAENLQQDIKVTQAGADVIDESTKTFTVNGVTFKMIRVDGGTFTMGATSEQGDDVYDWEMPAHQVTLSTYYIGETEVTQDLWKAVIGSNPSYFSGGQRPVEQVGWDDCQDFITKLNALTGSSFRLPTEAEWEFAARGGNKSRGYKYAGGNNIGDVAWYHENSNYMTYDVAQKFKNELGLYDMSGNVWEWCQDWYDSYSSSSLSNPTGPKTGKSRVTRGGDWSSGARCCRVSHRDRAAPSRRNNYLGLRLAL